MDNIIKPYEWRGCIHGHTIEESKLVWDNVWEFINSIDIPTEFIIFSNTNNSDELRDFMDYLENKYEYHDLLGNILFNIIDTGDFSHYLKKKYQNFNYWTETVETTYFKFK